MFRVDSYDGLCSSTQSFIIDPYASELSDASSIDSTITDSGVMSKEYCRTNSISTLDDMSEDIAESMSFTNTSDLCEDLRFIMGMPEMCDVKFLVGRQKIPVHGVKAILATRSREFYKMILSNHRCNASQEVETPRKQSKFFSKLRKLRRRSAPPTTKAVTSSSGHMIIEIEDFDAETFRRVISYLHSGSINVNMETVIGVMNAADLYGLDDLRTACFQFASKFINVQSVLQLLSMTEQYVSFKWTRYIKAEILEYIAEKAQDVLRHPDFENLSKQAAVLIFLRPELRATEETKWDAALRWSRRYCSKREMNLFRSTIKIFTPRINFYDIPLSKLTREIRPLSILPENLINRAIAHQSSPRLVIGQERTPCIPPQKPPRKSNVRRSLQLNPECSESSHAKRKLSSASSASGSTDSGIASCLEECGDL